MAIGLPLWAAAPREKLEKPEPESLASTQEEEDKGDSVLKAEDVIKVQVYQEDDINKQAENLTISKENAITLPLIGMVNLKDLTARQAEEKIRTLLQKDHIKDPYVTVTIIKRADRSVNVIGAVNNPGRIPFPPDRPLTIVDAISLAGGQSRIAKLKEVKLTRKGASTIINVDEIIKRGGKDAVRLEKDDVIFVPEIIF
jgi:polysaccharide biosynthesis/export protein